MFLRKYRATAKELEEPLAGTPKKKLSEVMGEHK